MEELGRLAISFLKLLDLVYHLSLRSLCVHHIDTLRPGVAITLGTWLLPIALYPISQKAVISVRNIHPGKLYLHMGFPTTSAHISGDFTVWLASRFHNICHVRATCS